MRNFYSPLKQCEPMLRFVFLTGITKFSQLSIFSELNNITNISMDEAYAGICGITKEELLTQMSDDIDRLAAKMSITKEEAILQLTDNYDGYHFTYPSPDIFNPYSLLNCFSKEKIGAYWFGSGTPTFLIEMMRKFVIQLISGGAHRTFHFIKDDPFIDRAIIFQFNTNTFLSEVQRIQIGMKRRIQIHRK